MGGAISELRGAIHTHVAITQRYPLLLEPMLAAVQFFLRTAETGEGTNRERPLDDLPMDVVMTDTRVFAEASTEVELLVENPRVIPALLGAIAHAHELTLAPADDPIRRWYDSIPEAVGHHRRRPMPRFVDVPADQLPRFQVAVLRGAIRCLRLMMFTTDGREQLERLGGPEVLSAAATRCPLDDYVQRDVKAIFSAVYGGDNAVRRIVIGTVPVVVEMMNENAASALVQLAGVQRLMILLQEAGATPYTPPLPTTTATTNTTTTTTVVAFETERDEQPSPVHLQPQEERPELKLKRDELFADLETYGVVPLVTQTLGRFADVDAYLSLYLHVCRWISFVAIDERNAKLVGQTGGIEGAICLLFKARELQRAKRAAEKAELARLAELERRQQAASEWSSILVKNDDPQQLQRKARAKTEGSTASGDGDGQSTAPKYRVPEVNTLASVDLTPTEIGQQAIWALDLLAAVDFNVSMMKLHHLMFLLEEIRLDPDQHELGAALIVTRRLRLIRWDEIGLPPTKASGKRVGTEEEPKTTTKQGPKGASPKRVRA